MPQDFPARVKERVLSRVVPQGDCLLTTYSRGSHGYGQVGWKENGVTTSTVTHRVAWAAVNGPIPPEMTVDHLCHVRPCVKPSHLRLLTNQVNARDSKELSMTSNAVRKRARKRKTPDGTGFPGRTKNSRKTTSAP